MASLDDYEDYEHDIERTEDQVKETENKFEQAQERVRALEQAVAKLEGDAKLRSSVQSTLRDAEQEKEHYEQKRQELRQDLNSMLRDVQQMQEQNYASGNTVQELESLGEDMSEQKEIVRTRQRNLMNMANKVSSLLNRLKSH